MQKWIIVLLNLFVIAASGGDLEKSTEQILNSNNIEDARSLNSLIVRTLDQIRGASKDDACDDFFQYSVGAFEENQGFLDILPEKFISSVQAILEKREWNDQRVDVISILKKFYDDCEIDVNRVSEVFKGFEQIEALHWPNWASAVDQDEWQQRDFDWFTAMGVLRKYGLNNVFFKEHVTVAYNNASKLIVELSIPDETEELWPLVRWVSNSEKSQFFDFKKFMHILGDLDAKTRSVRQKHVSNIEMIETKEILTIAQLQQRMPQIKWQNYFSVLLERPFSDLEHLEIQIRNPSYLEDIVTMLGQRTEKEISFYILLHFMYGFWTSGGGYFDYTCNERLRTQFPFGVNYIHNRFLENHAENQRALQQIFEALKMEFLKTLQKNKYKLDEAEVRNLKEKLNKMDLRIGTTPLDFEPDFYDKYYEGAFTNLQDDVLAGNPFFSVHEAEYFNFKRQHESIFGFPDKMQLEYFYAYDDTIIKVDRIEPFYVPERNIIIVPQQFLSAPLLSHRHNKIYQYAAAGFGIARALTAAFMPANLVYDTDGHESAIGSKLLQNEAFKNDLSCFHNTAFESTNSIPDFTGLQLMLDTFFEKIPSTPAEAGIQFEPADDQFNSNDMRDLFFRFFAQYFAGGRLSNKVYLDDNSARLNPIVAHAPQFLSYFNCNVQNKICTLW